MKYFLAAPKCEQGFSDFACFFMAFVELCPFSSVLVTLTLFESYMVRKVKCLIIKEKSMSKLLFLVLAHI